MVALNKKTKQAFQVVKYSLKVLERGTDTDFGKEEIYIYNPISRAKIPISRKDYTIYDNWNQVKDLVIPDSMEDEE